MVKIAFVAGSFLVVFPILLRIIDAVDNSLAFTFIALGMVILILGELNRARFEESLAP
ncbi:MAG TPA: hypothetical protein VE955_02845 [Candidatus Dormibacteraeota bacterium]|jgi:hypothetical protein|nr:hypothetical protein [Candidatus Dormibacteraeota bacterium]